MHFLHVVELPSYSHLTLRFLQRVQAPCLGMPGLGGVPLGPFPKRSKIIKPSLRISYNLPGFDFLLV